MGVRASQAVRGREDVVGYELSGNCALVRGDGLKLVRNRRPEGDGAWRLFDVGADPGEANDLARLRPEDAASLERLFDAHARAHAVLPMPEGYHTSRTVLANALRNTLLPWYKYHLVVLLALLAWGLRGLRRRAQRAHKDKRS